jgi:hypothetical protein
MRKTTVSPAFVWSPTRVATWTPFGNAGLSFQITASGVTWVCLSCAAETKIGRDALRLELDLPAAHCTFPTPLSHPQ